MKINCIIVDDEPLARKGLSEYISEVDFLNLEAEFENPVKASSILSQGNVQLVFMDIQMPKITGMDFLKTLTNAPPVIFTTAYPQYALDGFDLNALDYLVKPFSFERFLKAALKAKEYYEVRQKNIPLPTEVSSTPDYFFIKADAILVKIFFTDVLFVEALKNYVTIHTTQNKYISYLTFRSVEEYLPASQFIKTHKSYIVSIAKVNSIESNEIRIGNHKIPISREHKEEVTQKLLGDRFLKR